MDDTNTNLNRSGSGFQPTPNWGNQPPPSGENVPDQGGAPTGVPQGTTGTGRTTTETPVMDEDVVLDVLQQAPQNIDSFLHTTTATPYVTYSNLPSLTPSTINDPNAANQTLRRLQQPNAADLESFAMRYATNMATQGDDTEPHTTGSTDTRLHQMTGVQDSTGVTYDPQITARAKKTGVSEETIFKNIQESQNIAFKDIVGKLPPAQADRLTFAHFVPNHSKLSSDEAKQLASIEKQVREGVANDFGFSKDFTGVPVDTDEFLNNLGLQSDDFFEKLINAKIADGSLSESDARTLKAMNAGIATGTPTLKNLLAQLQGLVTTQLQAKFGFDGAYQPKGDVAFYNNVVNGDFAHTFQKNVDKYTGKITAEQMAKYEKNPNDPSLPPNIKELASQLVKNRQLILSAYPDFSSLPGDLKADAETIFAETKTETIGKYGLDVTWKPTMTALYAEGVDAKGLAAANSAMDTAREVLDHALKIGNEMPDGPEKTNFLNYLKAIGQALSGLQETIYAMQAAQSGSAKSANKAKLDMQLNDLDKQQKAADKTAEQTKKIRSMGPAGKALDWIIKLIILAFALALGPVAFMMALAYFMDSVVSAAMGSKKTGVQIMFEKIAESIHPDAAAVAVKVLLATVISVMSLNPYLAIQLCLTDSRMIQDMVKVCGGDKMAQEIVAMVVNMIVQIGIMIILMILTGGAATGALVAKVTELLAKSVKIALETASKIVTICRYVMMILMSSLQITQQSIQLNNSVVLSKIDIIKGEAEKYSEEIQAIIKALTKMIQKLLQLLQGNSEGIVSISNFQAKKYSDANVITSDIVG
jgi:hypothetical protein